MRDEKGLFMTIKDAFSKEPNLKIDYVFVDQCPHCHSLVYTIDDEYSFEGDMEYFCGAWAREYGVMDLDDEVHYDTSHYGYVFERETFDDVICIDCENAENEY